MRLLGALFVVFTISGCVFVLREDHFNPSSDHGTLATHRRVPPNERIDLAGEAFHLRVWASQVTSEVAWFGPLIPIFPGVLLGGMLDDKGERDERMTITVQASALRNSLSIDPEKVSVYVDLGSKPLEPSFVERECWAKVTGYDAPDYGSPRRMRVSGRQMLAKVGWARTANGEYCSDTFYLRYDIKPRDVESFEVRFGQVVADGVVSTPEPIRFKRAVDHWGLSMP